ncbi:MAG: hypothetical protein WBE92_00135 [Steroidobacteraceae bacterium]
MLVQSGLCSAARGGHPSGLIVGENLPVFKVHVPVLELAHLHPST